MIIFKNIISAADYHQTATIQLFIDIKIFTDLELLLLEKMFEIEEVDQGDLVYLYGKHGVDHIIDASSDDFIRKILADDTSLGVEIRNEYFATGLPDEF